MAQGSYVHYLCQDETRVGLKTLTGKVITGKGVKPTVEVKWERENFWIYGAIEPLSGKHFQHEYPKLNGEYFQQFLDWLSQQLGSDYAILQIDQAPAHTSSAIRWPENIIPLLQPPHAPELNPIETHIPHPQLAQSVFTAFFNALMLSKILLLLIISNLDYICLSDIA
ncbi:transposase [Scytonema sp. UIC 10036]|uniref:transposase n=1 Tax=Scytonema sp. UIC 10036 TaxID=2304196 RepID=UPI00140FDB0D|nr:transposase [Scytonema sp. UIC 10036]